MAPLSQSQRGASPLSPNSTSSSPRVASSHLTASASDATTLAEHRSQPGVLASHARSGSIPTPDHPGQILHASPLRGPSAAVHGRSNSNTAFHHQYSPNYSPTHSRKGSYAGTAGSGAGGAAGPLAAPRSRTTSLAAEEGQQQGFPGTNSPAGYIFDSSHYNSYWSHSNGAPTSFMTPSMSSATSDSHRDSISGLQSFSPGPLSSYAIMRQQSSASMRASGASAAALGIQRGSLASEQSSPRSSNFPHLGEGITGVFGSALPSDRDAKYQDQSTISKGTVRLSPSKSALHAPVIPRRNSSQRASISSLRRGSQDVSSEPVATPSVLARKDAMADRRPSSSSSSDSSDYGSHAGEEDDTDAAEMVKTSNADDDGGAYGDSLSAAMFAVGPPKLQRPHRLRGSPQVTPSALPATGQDTEASRGDPASHLSPGKKHETLAAVAAPASIRSEEATRLEPSLRADLASMTLAESADSASSRNSREAELEAAAIRKADEEDPHRPRTLKEARELAKLRAQARRNVSENISGVADPPTHEADGERAQGRIAREASGLAQHSKRYGQIDPVVMGDAAAEGGSGSGRVVAAEHSATMEELQAAVGDALDDLDFSAAEDGDASLSMSSTARDALDAGPLVPQLSPEAVGPVSLDLSNRSSVEGSFDSAAEYSARERADAAQEIDPVTASDTQSPNTVEGLVSPQRLDRRQHLVPAMRRLPSVAEQKFVPGGLASAHDREPPSATGLGAMSLAQALALSGPPSPATTSTDLPPAGPRSILPSTSLPVSRASGATTSLQCSDFDPSTSQIEVPGKTVPFPPSYKASAIAVDKKKFPPWERAKSYARFTNELLATPSGLSWWIEAVRKGVNNTSATTRKGVGRGHPSAAPAGSALSALNNGSVDNVHPRDVSDASVRSDQTFPTRGDGGKARDVTQVPIDITEPDSLPGALPANIPYPHLVPQPTRSLSSMSGVASSENDGSARSVSTSSSGQTMTERMGLRSRKLSTNALDALNSPAGAPTRERLSGTFSRGRDGASALSQNSLSSASSSPTHQRPGLFSSLGRRTSKRTAHPAPLQSLTPSGSVGNSSFGSVSGPRAPRLPGAAGALGRAIGYGYGHSAAKGSLASIATQDSGGQDRKSSLDYTAATAKAPEPMSTRSVSPLGEAAKTDMPSAGVGNSGSSGPRGPRGAGGSGALRNSPSVQNIFIRSTGGSAADNDNSPTVIPPYPTSVTSPSKNKPASPQRSQTDYPHRGLNALGTATSTSTSAGGGGGGGGLLSSLRPGARKNSWNSATSAGSGDRREERPEFKEALQKLIDVLPDADEDVLSGYLRRAGGNDLRAIGDYLGDQATGHLKAPNRRA
ncbi:unnamed protein product [Parajaminaea phylloscopi]